MRLYVMLSAAVLALLAVTACNSRDGSGRTARSGNSPAGAQAPGAATTSTPNDGVRRMTTAELRDALEKGTAVVVDVRSAESYKVGHIKGAQNIPEAEIASRKDELPRDKTIALYCS